MDKGTKQDVPHLNVSPIEARVCDECGKAFSSEEYLNKHIRRRHPGVTTSDPLPSPPLISQQKREQSTTRDDAPVAVLVMKEKSADGVLDSGKAAGCQEGADRGDEGVEKGARRLGELVREREQARFRSEMDSLKKEIEELKVHQQTVCVRRFGSIRRQKVPSLFLTGTIQ